MLTKAVVAFVASGIFCSLGIAQDSRYDFGASANVVFTNEGSGNGVTQSATTGWGAFGSARLRFNAKHSILFNYGREKNSQIYQTIDSFHVLANITEYSFGYMYNPVRKGRFEPFLLVGGGVLRFSPRTSWIFLPPLTGNIPDNVEVMLDTHKESQIALMYGGGVDCTIPKFHRFALRLQYRGFLYNAPDFKVDATTGASLSFFTGARGHMAEPSAGLVFRFR
jgi:hypothetical protein